MSLLNDRFEEAVGWKYGKTIEQLLNETLEIYNEHLNRKELQNNCIHEKIDYSDDYEMRNSDMFCLKCGKYGSRQELEAERHGIYGEYDGFVIDEDAPIINGWFVWCDKVVGVCQNDIRFEDGSDITTSTIKHLDRTLGILITRNTVYRLGNELIF